MKRQLQLIFLLWVFFCSTPEALPKVGMTLSTLFLVDDNIYQNYEKLDDVVYQPHLTIDYSLSRDPLSLQIYYTGSLTSFQDIPQRLYYYQLIGGSSLLHFKNSYTFLSLDIHFSQRVNRDDYAYHDYSHFDGLMVLRNNRFLHGRTDLGFQFLKRDYDQLSQYSFFERRGFFRKAFYFQSRTTLIAKIELGYKHYTETINQEEVVEITTNSGNRDRGQGKDRGRGNGNGTSSGGTSIIDERVVQVEIEGASIYQWITMLRIAQSIGSKTGLAIQGLIQRIPRGEGRYLLYQDSGYDEEDFLYNDPYGYESDGLNGEVTRMLPWNMVFKIGYELERRRYRYQIEIEEESSYKTMRKDDRNQFWMELKKSFPIRGFIKRIGMEVSYTFINNHSNDLYFNFDNHITQFGWTMAF